MWTSRARILSTLALLACMVAYAQSDASAHQADDTTRKLAKMDEFDKNLFDGTIPTDRLIGSSILVWIITSLAVSAGIGGGGLLVPCYLLVLLADFTGEDENSISKAVALSKSTIFGVAVGNAFFICFKRHPHADRPLIDFSTAVFMQGGELLGVIFGVLFNLLLPQIIVVILFTVVLGFNAIKTSKKAMARYKAETKKRKEAAADGKNENTGPVSMDALDSVLNKPAGHKAELEDGTSKVTKPMSPELEAILDTESRQNPPEAWAALLLMCIFLILISFSAPIKSSGKRFDDTFTNCNPGFWVVYLLPIPVYGGVMWYYAKSNAAMHKRKEAANFHFEDGDVRWTGRALQLFPLAATGAGAMAGLLGIGGGMILGPLFVALNFQPQVGTATTGFMILFTALGGTIQYLSAGVLPWRYFLWFASVGAIGGQTGQRVVSKVIASTGRPSIVVFILAGIISVSVLIMLTRGIVQIKQASDEGVDIWAFKTDSFECKN